MAKVNETTFRPGDAILFNRGETFYGTITVNRSGSPGNFIVYGAYGSGALPVITGFTTISNWRSDGGGIYEYTCATCQPNLNMITFQGTLQPMGRWPKLGTANGGYLTINSHTGYTSLTSTGLSGALNYVGGEVVSRKSDWIMDRARILRQSGTTITCVQLPYPFGGTFYNFFDNHGFFVQNHVNTCTQLGEWAYDSALKKIKMYFGGNTPSSYSVQASTIDYLVSMSSHNYVIFENISFKGSNSRTFSLDKCDHIQINNCDIKFSGIDAIYANNSQTNNITLNNCTVSYTNNNGITGNNSTNWTITNNSILNTGIVRGAGLSGDGQYQGTSYIGGKSLVQYNIVKNTGYIGIEFYGSSTVVRNNFVDSFDIVKRDGGGIYTWGETSNSGRKVIGNIVINGIGDNYGCGVNLNNPLDQNVAGIYMDGGTRNVVIDSNTVANCSRLGFELNGSQNIQMKGNTSFNNGVDQINYTDMGSSGVVSPSTLTIKNNIFFAKDSDQLILQMQLASNYISSIGTIDSNYYCRPIREPSNVDTRDYNDGGIADVAIGTEYFKSLDKWQTYSSQDAHTHKSPKIITEVNDLRFEYNATSSPLVVHLPYTYIDVKGTTYNGTINLAPYSSVVLIRNGAITNQPPKANAGPDQTILLPSNTINLSGSGTDPDGTISSYLWTKISGPTACTIANINSASTSVTGLVEGVYKFEFKVTDSNGAFGEDTMQVTVNAVAIKAGIISATANQPPIANSGGNQTIILPINTVSLNGSGTDINGTVVIFLWTKISGPSSGTITNANSATTTVSAMVQGVYQFELKVTDNNGATGRDTMQVTVNAATNIAPVANAGSNSTITLPVNTTSLAGSGSDADGTIVSYIWAKISGPTTYNIVNASSPVTDVSGLVQGVYQFELTVTDNHGATGIDTIQVTVNAAANIPPVANAGQDQTITLPTNAALLNGSGTDADGTIAGYSWEQISGPSVSWIASSNTRVTLARNLVAGTYEFELTVTDNMGAIGKDTVVVVVLRLNLDVQSNNIKIYPNPVANTATLEINTTTTNSKLLVVITNMQGQIVYRNELASGQNNIQDIINISNLSKGTYALTVYFSDQEKQTIKVIRMD
jgi:hypothetical protein